MIEQEKVIKERQIAYSQVFSERQKNSKLVLDDLEKFCGFKNTSVGMPHPDALQTMFNEGKRRVFLRILGMMDKETENE